MLEKGYSGAGIGKNNASMEAERSVGPIPRGLWVIGAPYHSRAVGPFALPLTPSGHNARERTAFVIHGDSIQNPGKASNGCMVFSRATREKIHEAGDLILKVIA